MNRLWQITVASCAWLAIVCVQAAPAKRAIPYKTWQTKQGVPVYLLTAHELPILDVALVFDAGSARDGAHPGIAAMVSDLMDSGSKDLSVDDIAAAFDQVGAEFRTTVSEDRVSLSLRTLVDPSYQQRAVHTFLHMLATPQFPKREVERVRRQQLMGIKADQQNPKALADQLFRKAVYGDHPYGHTPSGTTESVQAITRDDILAFYHAMYTVHNAMIVIVGDIEKPAAKALAKSIAATLQEGAKPSSLPKVQPNAESQQWHEYPSKQTTVLWGQTGIAVKDPDYFPLAVGNHILGSGMTSRLFYTVRSQRGLVYSIYSLFKRRFEPGPFFVAFQTRTLAAKAAFELAKQVVSEFVERGPTEQEVLAAKQHIIGSFALQLAGGNQSMMQALISLGFYHLPADYFDTYQNNIAKVTVEQVKEAFQRRIQPKRFVSVAVGKEVKVAHHD